MQLRVTHTTRYNYESPVSHGLNEVRLTPRSTREQHVLQTDLRIEPAPSFLQRRKDYFGNDVTSFAVFEKHDRFEATAESVVAVTGPTINESDGIPWETARELLAEPSDEACLEASEFVYGSPYVAASNELAHYARATFEPNRPLFEAACELSHRIHTEFEYQPKSTSIDMPLSVVLRNRRGVCQDFAHVMIGALRSIRLAARYVSGYVRPGAKVQGAQASHAWVSVFVPGCGWCCFDPTNDIIPSDGHITLAWGRDYGDVTPVKGVTLGGGGQHVEVEVYVSAVDA
jgi:transglutaminase-like putative cysteine protease